MVSEAPRGRYDLDKPENITDLLSAIKSDNLKKLRDQELSEATRARLKAQDPAPCWVLPSRHVT